MSLAIEAKKLIDRALGVPLVLACAAIRGAKRPPPSELRRVLLVKLWGVGNLSMFLPLARAVKRVAPAAAVDVLTLAQNREMVVSCADVDDAILFDPRGMPLARLLRIARELRARRYDAILDGEQFLRASALLCAAARPAFSAGFATKGQRRHALYDVAVTCDESRHMVHGFRALLEAAGIEPPTAIERFAPRSRAAARRVRARLAPWRESSRPLVVLHPGSGDHFEGRRWPPEHFARLADLLVERLRAQIVFSGNAAERGLIARARRRMSAPSADWSGSLSLVELVELLAASDLLVSNDTAPVHLAAALDLPQVAIYGPNVPRLYGPLSNAAKTAWLGLGCSPCITNTNAKTSFCRRPLCVQALDPLAILDQAHALLAARARERTR